MIVNFHLLRKPPQRIYDRALRHLHGGAASQAGSWHRPHLAAHFNMCRQVFLGAKSLGTGRAGVPSLFGVHRRQVPVQVCAVSEVLQAVHALHQLLLEVDGLLVPVGVGLEGEAGRTLGAEVASRRRLGHRRLVQRLGELEARGLRRVMGRAVRTRHVGPVQGQGHERQGVAVLVLPEMLQAAEQPLAQGAGEALRGPGAELWQESVP